MSFCVVRRKGATGCPMLLCRSADRSWQFLKRASLAISVSVGMVTTSPKLSPVTFDSPSKCHRGNSLGLCLAKTLQAVT